MHFPLGKTAKSFIQDNLDMKSIVVLYHFIYKPQQHEPTYCLPYSQLKGLCSKDVL